MKRRYQLSKPAPLLLVLLVACTAIGHQKVEGWPEMTVIELYVPHAEMRDKCVPYAPFGTAPEACAEFDLDKRTCTITYSADFPPPEFFKTHERKHCLGFEHEGDHAMRDFLEQYNRRAK